MGRGRVRPDLLKQGSKIYVLCSESKEHKSFSPGTRPGRPVTGVTGQSFMCYSFMCASMQKSAKGCKRTQKGTKERERAQMSAKVRLCGKTGK